MFCKACHTEKEAEGFYASNKTRCKECIKQSVNAHRQANLERIRAYDRLRGGMSHRVAARIEYQQTPQGKAAVSRARQKYMATHSDRRAAHVAVGNAVRDGRLLRQQCWVCGARAEAHHPDYSRPLDVVWLCQPHHKQAHALVANDNNHQEAA